MSQTFEVGAYFYPLTTYSPDSYHRVWRVGDALGYDEFLERPNEHEVIKNASALFPGHEQPQTYCLDAETTDWDDYHLGDLMQQIIMARQAGISFFVFDSYCGYKNGEPCNELTAPLDNLLQLAKTIPNMPGVFWGGKDLPEFKYARMETLESPRVVLPMPPAAPGFGGMFAEPIRQYDITPESARYIIDRNIPHWKTKAYLRVNDRPYLSILMPNFGDIPEHIRQERMELFMNELRAHARMQYGQNPYIVGVIRGGRDAERWLELQVDAITHYAYLPDHSPGAPPTQEYSQLMEDRKRSWEELHQLTKRHGTPYIPAPSVGWDASPRGERGHTWEEVAGKLPYSPIVVGNTPERVGAMLGAAIASTLEHVPEDQRLIPIFAWNEIGEGGVLLPRLRPDGTVDRSYLEVVKRTIAAARAAGGAALLSK